MYQYTEAIDSIKWVRRTKAIGFDLDGVLYFGNQLAQDACETVSFLRSKGLRVLFITNNSARTRTEIAEKITRMGIQASFQDVFSSAYAAAVFLRGIVQEGATILVIGSDGLKKELRDLNMDLVMRPPCDFIVVGYDVTFDYERLCVALDAILGGAKFLACNRVANYPVENGRLMPGCGAMVAAIESASQKKPDFLVGKPNTLLLEMACSKHGLKPNEILMVGDELESDIIMANHFGSPSAFLLNNSAKGNLHPASPELRPTVILNGLKDLVALFHPAEGGK